MRTNRKASDRVSNYAVGHEVGHHTSGKTSSQKSRRSRSTPQRKSLSTTGPFSGYSTLTTATNYRVSRVSIMVSNSSGSTGYHIPTSANSLRSYRKLSTLTERISRGKNNYRRRHNYLLSAYYRSSRQGGIVHHGTIGSPQNISKSPLHDPRH